MIKTKFIVVFVIVALAVGITSSQLSFGQEIQITENVTLSSEQVVFIIIIGAIAGTVKAWQGYDKSPYDFDAIRFVNGVRDSILIAIPAAFGVALGMPEINAVGYVLIFFGIVGGTQFAQKAKKPSIPSNATPEQITKILETSTSLQKPLSFGSTTETSKTVTSGTSSISTKTVLAIVPKLGPEDAVYQTNFIQTKDGNALAQGQDLWIRVFGVRSYLSAILRDSSGNIIEIDQSSTHDEDGDIETTRLEMYGRDKKPLPKGKYSLEIRGDYGPSDAQGIKKDEFLVI